MVIFYIFLALLLPQAVSASALSDAANALATGQWVSFSTNGFNNGDIMRTPAGCTSGSILEYNDKGGGWTSNGLILFEGGIHGVETMNCIRAAVIRYVESTNTWDRNIQQLFPSFDNAFPDTIGGSGGSIGHGYHHDTIVGADMYHRQYGSGKVMKFSNSTQGWSQCSQIPGNHQVAGALEYFPDRNSLVWFDGDWGVYELSLASGNCTSASWVQRASAIGGGFSPQLTGMGSYSNQSRYSPKCQCVVLGGGGSSNQLYRYMSNGTFAISSTSGAPPSINIPDPGGGSIFTVDPVGGDILVWSLADAASIVRVYNPVANTWTAVSNSSPLFQANGNNLLTAAIPISTYGVIMFVFGRETAGGAVYLYKHGASTPDTQAPTVPTNLVATAISSNRIDLTWTASTDNSGFIANYQIDRCTGSTSCGTFAQIATSTTNSATDIDKLSSQTQYSYRVRACDASGNCSGNSAATSATTPVADTTAPTVAVTDPPNTTPLDAGTAGIYTLVGTGTDNIGVTSVTLTNDRGGSYTVNTSGTSVSWSRAVNLFNGTNVITTISHDAAGNNSTSVVRTVTTVITGPSLTPVPTATSPGATVNVAFAGIATPTAKDWIGLYSVGAPDAFNPAYPWFYTFYTPNCTQASPPSAGPASGSCNFTMPAVSGSYNFRMFSNDTETNPLAVSSTVVSTAVPDAQAPSTPTGLALTSVNTTLNLTWNPSSDNIGVTGYRVERSPAGCASFVQVYTPSGTSQSDSGLSPTTTYCYRVRATDAAGNLSGYSAIAQGTTGIAPTGSDFTTRCAAAGVIRCEGFDSTSILAGVYGNNRGSFNNSASSGGVYEANNLDGTCGSGHIYSCPLIDTSIKASGAGSLRFDMNTGTNPVSRDAAGQWFLNFSDDLSVQFGAGQEFWVQFRAQFNDGYVNNVYTGGVGEGPKLMDLSAGDTTGCTTSTSTNCRSSNTNIEIITQNLLQRKYPQMYGSVTWDGGQSWGQFQQFLDTRNSNYRLQNARPDPPGCYYNVPLANGNCFQYLANEWITFKYHVRLGSQQGAFWMGSLVELFMGRDGQPTEPVISFTGDLYGGGGDRYGKIWLMNYITGFDQTQAHALSQVWYDELIISTQNIADPGPGTGTGVPVVTITSPTSASSYTINTATINLGGTVQ